ncbi:MAG TPA: cobyrinate a,c-diamide synthase [Symbiobacteriaceae bacterium]
MDQQGTAAVPRIVIGGVQSGAGKTTVAVGLMRALAARGLRVQGFKSGPDYIDPHAYGWATGRPGRNLDTYFMTPAQVQNAFAQGAAGADVAVVEGVMGLFDGVDGSGELGSTAYLAKLLGAPVLLVIDASASARSVAAVALGFQHFDPNVRLAGVICNRVGGDRHVAMLREALAGVGIPLVGALGHQPGLQIPEGRLGLALSGETEGLSRWIAAAGQCVAEQVDLDQVLALARGAGPLPDHGTPGAQPDPDPFAPSAAGQYRGLRIGVARDAAFWFYYEDTFDLFRHWGVEPVFFSPLADSKLPAGIHGLYLGGGVPEQHAAALAGNEAMRREVAAACRQGLPILAEGGGYLYLLEGLIGEDGTFHPMAGCVPGVARVHPWLQAFGYRQAEPGSIRGHLFHYARVEGDGEGLPAWRLYRPDGTFERADGYRRGPVTGSFLHIHHASQPAAMEAFLAQCREAAAGGKGSD